MLIQLYVLSVAAFPLKWQSRIVVTEMACPAQPKIVTIWPFTGKLLPILDLNY